MFRRVKKQYYTEREQELRKQKSFIRKRLPRSMDDFYVWLLDDVQNDVPEAFQPITGLFGLVFAAVWSAVRFAWGVLHIPIWLIFASLEVWERKRVERARKLVSLAAEKEWEEN